MANCTQYAQQADVFLGLAIADAKIAREKEASAAILAILFAPAAPGEIAAAQFARDSTKNDLQACNVALKSLGKCLSENNQQACAQKIEAVRTQVDGWASAMNEGRPDIGAIVLAAEDLRKRLTAALSECNAPIIPDPVETTTEAADVDVVLLLEGGFGAARGYRRYAQPDQETERPEIRTHWIEPRPGAFGPRFLARCRGFDVETWKIRAEARVAGAAVAANVPFDFKWDWDGKPITQGVQLAPTSSSVELTVPSVASGKRLSVTTTSGSIQLVTSVYVGVPKTREECSLVPK